MQLKKAIAAGALGALMAGSTLAFAASLSDFPAPFVSGGAADFLMVVGATADPQDIVGAIDVAARLGGAPVTTDTVTCTGSSGGATVTNGVRLDTPNTKIRLGDQLTGAKDTLTSTDLSGVLASSSVLDTSGNEYKYDLYLAVGSVPTIAFANPTSTPTTPDIAISAGGVTSTQKWYTAKVVFQKPLEGSISSGTSTTIDGKAIKLFGQDYTFGSGTTELSNTTVTLYGGGEELGLDWSGTSVSQTVTVSGKNVAVTLNGITTGNDADLTIDGTSYTQAAGSYITTSSGVRIYVKSSVRYGQGGVGRVVLKVGADKVTLTNGQTVKIGSTDETVQGTAVTITSGSTGKQISISSIEIAVFPANTDKQKIIAGSEFVDPVFKSFKLALSGVSPALNAATRNPTAVSYSGDNYAQVSFTDYHGTAKTMTIGNATTTALTGVSLTDGTYTIHVAENDTVARNEYTIINQGGFSHLMQYTSNDLTASSPSVTLRDVVSGVDYKVYLSGAAGALTGTTVIDGKTYYIKNLTDSIQFMRGSALRTGGATTAFALFSPIKLKNGEELVIAKPTTLVNNTYYSVPGNDTVVGGEGWYTFMYNDTGVAQTFNAGHTPMTINATDLLFPTGGNLTGTNSIAVVVIEEKDAANARNSVIIPVTQSSSGTPYRVSISTPTLTTGATFVSTSDSYLSKALDIYGTLVTSQGTSGTGQYQVTVSYPDDQVAADVMMGGLDMAVSTSAAAAGATYTTQTVAPIKTMVGKLDTEFLALDAASKMAKNVISIGGPAVNRVTAELLGKTFPAYGAASGLTENKALIKLVEGAFSGSKVALVVAGWEAVDTRRATSALQTFETAGLTGTEKLL